MVLPRLFPRETEMHFCTAKIALASDITNVMIRGPFNPISWPEIEVIRYIHGNTSVEDIEVIASVKQSGKDERARLNLIYGEEPLIALWGGRNTPGEMEDPKAKKIKDGTVWLNPITFQQEVTGAKKEEPEPEEAETEEVVAGVDDNEDPIGDEPETKVPAKKKK
jgi:hypothetical protein